MACCSATAKCVWNSINGEATAMCFGTNQSRRTLYLGFSTGGTQIQELVRLATGRWIIERDDEELQRELGLGHLEGQGWRGFRHQATSASRPMGSWSRRGAVSPPPEVFNWDERGR